MTDELPPPPEESSAPEDASTKVTPLTKVQKLEAKAARLREQEAAKAAAGPAAPMSTRALIPWAVAVAVLVLALVGTLVFALHERDEADKGNAALKLSSLRSSALKKATSVATSFGTYDYQTLNADFARTRAYLTPSFAADFSKITTTLGSLITQDKGQIVGTVKNAGIQSISSTTAVVLVFLDQKVTTAESSTPRLDHNRLELTLTLQPDKKWLVSQLVLV
jgi:Mce-associated membrane protein